MQSMQAEEQEENGRAAEREQSVPSVLRAGEWESVELAALYLLGTNTCNNNNNKKSRQITAAGKRASASPSTALNMKKRRRPLTLTLSVTLSLLLALYLGIPPLRPLVVTFVLTLRRRRATRRDAISPLYLRPATLVQLSVSRSVIQSVCPSPHSTINFL